MQALSELYSLLNKYLPSIIFSLILSFSCSSFAGKIYEYGFENWSGSRYTTSDYPFSSGYASFCTEHDNSSEVITGWSTWTPHSGSYFFVRDSSPGYLPDPSISGITIGEINDSNVIGYDGAACSTNNLKLPNDITTGEMFISFWARTNHGFQTIENGGRCKWIRVGTDDGSGDIYMHLTTDSVSPQMHFYNAAEGYWLGSGVTLTNAHDGNWHKYSYYINLNTGTIRGWYDVETETAENTTKSWTATDGQIGVATSFDWVQIQGNFSANSPTEFTMYALDDIEMWDSMPDGSSCSSYNGDSSGCAANGCVYCSGDNTCGASECCADQASMCTTESACGTAGWNWCLAVCQSASCGSTGTVIFTTGTGSTGAGSGTGSISFQ